MRIRSVDSVGYSLQNEGFLSFFLVGTGSAFSKTLNQNNFTIIKGETHIQVDCGTKFSQALFDLGKSVTDIDTWLITHSHADHIGGLEEVMLMGRYVAKRRPNIIITPQYQDVLWDFSLKGGAAFNERSEGGILDFEDLWVPIRPTLASGFSRDTYELVHGDIKLTLFRTMHFPDSASSWQDSAYSLGMVVDDRIMFTGDTRFDRELIEEFDAHFGLEYIFHDVQFYPGGVHASLTELESLPESVKKRMILVHYSDAFEKQREAVMKAGFYGFGLQSHYYDFV